MVVRPGLLKAIKAIPGSNRAPGPGRISPAAAEMYSRNSYANVYGTAFLPRPSRIFSEGAFAPMPPIQPTPLDQPPDGGQYPDPRLWQYTVGWNLPTPPGSEGMKLASFDQLRILSQKYSVARAAIELRIEEIRGLEWEIALTTDAAKAYQKDLSAMRDFGERKAKATRFFSRPDPDFNTFDTFLNALLEEIFVYDALSLIFRPKFGERLGMSGRGLLGSKLDCLQLISGPTIRPLIGMHGEHPAPPAPAYQQFLYGVPRSDYVTLARGSDIDEFGLGGSEVNQWDKDVMYYAPYWPTRETPYGFPPVERALIPIIAGLQKQEFQLDYFTEGTIPAVYISPGDNNMTPSQIKELQDALNGIAGDPAYHMKVLVLPPGSKVEPQRPVDLSDSFDFLVMNQVCMAFDVQPIELGILPNIGSSQQGPSASAMRFGAQEARDVKSRKSTKPLLKFICDIFNYILQDICDQRDMQFQFAGLVDDEDKQAITQLGVEQIQNGVASIDEIRERLDLPPWGLQETSEPIVMTQQGPIPFSMAPQLLQAMMQQQGGNQQSSGGKSTSKPKRGTSATKPNGSHPAPVSPSRPTMTPGHAAATGALQRPQRGKTGGTPGRSPVAGSRKRGEGRTPTQGRQRNNGSMPSQGRRKAVASELDAMRRHLIKGRDISGWETLHIPADIPGVVAAAVASGMTPGEAVTKASSIIEGREDYEKLLGYRVKSEQWPGWQHDLALVEEYIEKISDAFRHASEEGEQLRRKMARGEIWLSVRNLHDMINDNAKKIFLKAMTPMWSKAYHIGYESAAQLIKAESQMSQESLQGFLDTEGRHWMEQIARTGLGNSNARSQIIARTEVARAVNAAAIQCYKDHGVSYKQLLIAPDDTCKLCRKAAKDGVIPLDAPFSSGGVSGPLHPDCRCIPAPASMDVIPPMAMKAEDDDSKVSFLLIRAKDPENNKWHYLLQKRSDNGTWGLPGGTHHEGEDAWHAALRETQEEVGDIPPVSPKVTLQYRRDDKLVHIFLVEAPFFHPSLGGDTQGETLDTGWFRRKEVGDLDLHPNFREQWEGIDWKDIAKRLSVDESGNVSEVEDGANGLLPTGSRWPIPHRADGAEDENENEVSGSWGQHGPPGMWPGPAHPDPGPEALQIPGGRSLKTNVPMTGVTPPKPAQPMTPAPAVPETANPQELVERWDPQEQVNVGPPSKVKAADGNLTPDRARHSQAKPSPAGQSEAEPSTAQSAAENHSYPNPFDAHHVYLAMASNFPPDAIDWVKRAKWQGPIEIPWEQIDTHDVKGWAAYKQPGRVKEFETMITAHKGDVKPAIMIQDNDSQKSIIIDGHHRAMAWHNLGKPVLAYLGQIDPKDRQAAEEAHSKQIHSGSSPQNKAARPKVSKESVNYREGTPEKHCGNCVMFHNGSCDLVMGVVSSGDTCDRWEAK